MTRAPETGMPTLTFGDVDKVPRSHARLALLILEGYAYLLLIIAVFAAALGLLMWGVLARRPLLALVALGIGLPLLTTTTRAVRSLFFRLPVPRGVPVSAAAAPRLHEMVEELRRKVQAPRVDRVLVGNSFNASAVQIARGGFFRPRNTLLIGYPLLATFAPAHLRAVVAHELAHLSRAHGRFAAWVYRTHLSWVRLMRDLESRGAAPAHAYWLRRRYLPRLLAYSAAVARQQEYLADRCAANAAGSAVASETLVAIDVAASHVEETYWRGVFDRVEQDPEPPRPFAAMTPRVWEATTANSRDLIDALLRIRTAPEHSHPCLRDRLEALGEPARVPAPAAQTAGALYLGEQMGIIAEALDTAWQANRREDWRNQHEAIQRDRQRLRELSGLSTPTPQEIFERGELVEEFEGPESALPHYQAALALGHAAAALAAGRLLLSWDDDSGIALIDGAMEADTTLIPQGCSRVVPYLKARNRFAEAHRYEQRMTREATRTDMAEAERRDVSAFDRFVPHEMPAPSVAAVVARLARDGSVIEVFLVRRELRYAQGSHLVCAIVARGGSTEDIAGQLRREAILPPDTIIRLLDRHDAPLKSALESVDGSRIYAR